MRRIGADQLRWAPHWYDDRHRRRDLALWVDLDCISSLRYYSDGVEPTVDERHRRLDTPADIAHGRERRVVDCSWRHRYVGNVSGCRTDDGPLGSDGAERPCDNGLRLRDHER